MDEGMNQSYCVLRVVVPTQKAGIIIGKGGSNIKSLNEQTGAKVKVHDVPPGSNDRVVMISAKEEEDSAVSPAKSALMLLLSQLLDGEDPSGEGYLNVTLLMPSGQTGTLIGKGGEMIRNIIEQSGAQIRISETHESPACSLPEDKTIDVSGILPNVKKAVELVADRLRKFACDRSILPQFEQMRAPTYDPYQQQGDNTGYMQPQNVSYNTRNAPQVQPGVIVVAPGNQMSTGYNNYNQPQGQRVVVQQQPQIVQGNAVKQGAQGGYTPQGQTVQVYHPPVPHQQQAQQQANTVNSGGGQMNAGYTTYNQGGGSPGYGMNRGSGMPPVVQQQPVSLRMPVAASQIGAVLGPDNSSLNQIRSLSGAEVSVSTNNSTGESTVEITGDSAQVQAAQALTTAFLLNANGSMSGGGSNGGGSVQPQMPPSQGQQTVSYGGGYVEDNSYKYNAPSGYAQPGSQIPSGNRNNHQYSGYTYQM